MAHQGEIDLGVLGGLKQLPYSDVADTPGTIMDKLVCNSGSVGLNITQLTQRFPNYVALLGDAGFSNTDIVQRTYPTMVYGEAALRGNGGYSGFGFNNRTNIRIPPGYWWFNTEMRSGQHRNIGAGPQFNAGEGGTVIRICETNWKSIHGSQNDDVRVLMHCWTYAGEDGLTPQPICVGSGYEYMHYMTLEQCAVLGNSAPNSFWNSAQPTEIGFVMDNSGEQTMVRHCHVWNMKGMGVLMRDGMARPMVKDTSFFYNQICAVGCAGGEGLSTITLDTLSCDNNPYVLMMYRTGSNIFGTGPFMPRAVGANNPGGSVNFNNVKVEAFACRGGGYGGMTECPELGSTFYGRGGMMAHLTGRFHFTSTGGSLNAHNGMIWTALEFSDQDDMNNAFPGQGYAGGLHSYNSHAKIHSIEMSGVKNWLADWSRQRVHVADNYGGDDKLVDFNWENLFDNGAAWGERASTKYQWPTAVATHRGIQPFINASQALTWSGGAPTFNYHPVTGTNF